jgi:hypothetical protein
MFRAPGFVVSQEQTLAATLVLNTMFIFSVFVFATLIGLVGDEVKQSVSNSCCGKQSLGCKQMQQQQQQQQQQLQEPHPKQMVR